MLNATLAQAEPSCSTLLYYMLVMLCKVTALTRVVNAGAQEGLESWRAPVLHHEPTSLTRNAGLLQELLDFSFEGEFAAQMVQFDRYIDRYENASGENFPNNIRIGVASRMLPDGPLKQHLVLNTARLTTWEALKAEIDSVRRAQAAASSAPQPMDLSARRTQGLDAFQKGNPKSRGKGKDKSKPDDDISKTPCPICGKTGHWKSDCWYKEVKLKPKGKGKDGKGNSLAGTQQQSGKGKKGVKCWNCDARGHVAKDCPKKNQSLSAAERQAQPSNVTSGATGETMLSGFFLTSYEKQTELNRFESKNPICPGNWHRQGCSEISGSCGQDTWLSRHERQRDRTCVHVCYWIACDRPRTTTYSGYCRWQSAWLAHANGPSSKELHQCLRHVCGWTSSRLRLRQQQQRREPCERRGPCKRNGKSKSKGKAKDTRPSVCAGNGKDSWSKTPVGDRGLGKTVWAHRNVTKEAKVAAHLCERNVMIRWIWAKRSRHSGSWMSKLTMGENTISEEMSLVR